MTPSIAVRNRVDDLVDSIAADILGGRMAPGTALKEEALAAQLGVSRNTLREAIRVLAERGLVVRTRHRSAAVAALDRAAVLDLYRVRRLLELSAIDAGPPRTPESLYALGAAVERLCHVIASNDGPAVIDADLAFHRAIVGLHRSQRIDQAFAVCLDELRLGLAFLAARDPVLTRLLEEHRSMYALLLREDRAGCRAILSRHLEESERSVLGALVSD